MGHGLKYRGAVHERFTQNIKTLVQNPDNRLIKDPMLSRSLTQNTKAPWPTMTRPTNTGDNA
ncbi:MAG: hypothetical protein WC117_01110 [Sphaerochaetaceae bacterium]